MSRICFSRNLKELADLLPEGKQVVVLYDKAPTCPLGSKAAKHLNNGMP